MGQRRKAELNARTARALQPGQWLSRPIGARGSGELEARGLTQGGVAFYVRLLSGGKQVRIPIGNTLSFRAAMDRATELSLRYQAGERNLYDALKAERAERERERQRALAIEHRTLGALLEAYTAQLERDGKLSTPVVRRELEYNVHKAWPKLWETPVSALTADDLLAIVAKPAADGKLRQAEKIRAYLRAAFAAGIKARHNAKALPALRALRITENPAAALTPIEGANKARSRALSLTELRAYWRRIQDPEHAALRFHLLTGAQRIKQLARATLTDYDADAKVLRLWDTKGRRIEPRAHHVPILPEAMEAMRAMHAGEAGPYLFTATWGVSGMDTSGLSKRLQVVAEAMQAAGELESGPFSPGDLRRTVETRLAAANVSSDTLARLQSHGLGGVQARHYNVHDYLEQTRAALETLHRLVTEKPADVIRIRKGAK